MTGWVVAAFYAANAIATAFFGRLLRSGHCRRKTLAILAAVCHVAFFFVPLFLEVPKNYEEEDEGAADGGLDGEWGKLKGKQKDGL